MGVDLCVRGGLLQKFYHFMLFHLSALFHNPESTSSLSCDYQQFFFFVLDIFFLYNVNFIVFLTSGLMPDKVS